MDPAVSVILPCLNEARTLGACVARARSCLVPLGLSHEILLADNGSSDGSVQLARSLGVRVVNIPQRGYGQVLRGGFTAAKGEWVIMGDADGSYDFSQLKPFLEKLAAGYDLVLGNRFRGGVHPGAMPWLHRHLGNPFLTGLLNFLFHARVGDAHCGLRAFRRSVLGTWDLQSPGMELASEMVVRAALCGHRIAEVPIRYYPDGRDRPSHLRPFRDGWRHLAFLVNNWLLNRSGFLTN